MKTLDTDCEADLNDDPANINSNKDSLKETCLKYGNLIDKDLLKMKNSKGKTKLCINSLAHKSENVYNLSDILIRDHDVRTYFTGLHGHGKILHFAGSGHHRILKLWGGNLLSQDP